MGQQFEISVRFGKMPHLSWLCAVVEADHTRNSFLSLLEFPKQQQNEVSFMISPYVAQL